MINWQALLVALMLMTRLPVPTAWQPQQYHPQLQSRAVLFYPLVGAIIGALLLVVYGLLPNKLHIAVQAVLLVGGWVWLTGALHLDGLADTVDALAAAHKDPARVQTVLKDSHLGAMGAAALVLAMLLKVALVTAALQLELIGLALMGAPVAARLLAVIYMLLTPYARKQGIAAQIHLRPYRAAVLALAVLVLAMAFVTLGLAGGLLLLVMLGFWLFYWRRLWLKKVGGYTGDCVGALIEVAELLTLLVVVGLL